MSKLLVQLGKLKKPWLTGLNACKTTAARTAPTAAEVQRPIVSTTRQVVALAGSEVPKGPVRQAVALRQNGNISAALKLIESYLKEHPDEMETYWGYGQCLEQAGRHQEALQAYERLLENLPDHNEARQRCELLSRILRRPASATVPSLERSWNTRLPNEAMMQIQLATHAYTYRGVPLIKNPFDYALYPLLLWNAKPRTIIEIGSKSGGSALWLADLLDTYGLDGHVFSLDIVPVTNQKHSRVTFLEADGRQLGQYLSDEFLNRAARPLLIIEDADHSYETSLATLQFFARWLQKGEYIIIEDGILSDMMSIPAGLCGPHRAIKEFLAEHPGQYEISSEYCDFFGYNYTWCTNGYLRKVG